MEKSQFDVCLKVLKRLDKEGVLNELILIGSWCAYFYQYYFTDTRYEVAIRTRDLDFLVVPHKSKGKKVDIPKILNEMGFILEFKGNQGFMRLIHPELFIEFLVPELGRGTHKPFPLPQLGINAQPLRFLNFLTVQVINLRCDDFVVRVPHPAYFALHKLIIFQRRKNAEKIAKDRDMAIRIFQSLIEKNEAVAIKKAFDSAPQKWQSKIIAGLRKTEEKDIINILKG